jgi:23S rRNA (cytidine1920-2'-O)/16S rRNA (cytidine1409-2'-O)-methyltransferase
VRRRLDAELVRRGLASSRSRAVEQIEAGQVTVAGAPARSAARLVDPAEPINLLGPPARFVSRGGDKLDAALDRFGVDVEGRRGLDAGASTGGFTDCLLQRGAREVVAVDVGRGQLAWQLREDPRVRVLERTNLRHLEPATIGDPADVAVADLSFISLLVVASALDALTTPAADLVLLVKPQFEAGRAQVGRGGIVRDPAVHRDVLGRVVAGFDDLGLVTTGAMASPRSGADGNREFLVHVRKRHGTPTAPPVPVSDADLDAATTEGLS